MRNRTVKFILLLWICGIPYSDDISEFYSQLLTISDPNDADNNGLTVFPILNLSNSSEERAMAGAYTAVVRDTGYFEANPAASALLAETQLGVFHSNIIADVNLDSVSFAIRKGDLGFGLLGKFLTTSFTAYNITGNQIASSYYVEALLGANISYAFGKDYYSSGLVVGANVKLAYRSIPQELYQHVSSVASKEQSAFGIMADLGMLIRFDFLKGYNARDRNFSIGVSIRNLGPPVLNEPLPTMATIGIAYSPLRFVTISGDFLLPLNLVNLADSEKPGFATGVSFQLTNFLALKAGFGVKGGNPRFSAGTDLDLGTVNLAISYGIDYTTQFKIPDHLSIQARFDLGDEGRLAQQKEIDNLYVDALVALASANYKLVIEKCKLILDRDPSFNPAIDTLKTAQDSQRVLDTLDKIRTDNSDTNSKTK